MANSTFGVNIIPKNNTVTLGNSDSPWTVVSPNMTGTPTAPTASANTNTTQVATTAFVQTAVSGKVNTTSIGVASGVAGLDTGGKVPTSQLPDSVFDVKDYADYSEFPLTGAADTLYVDTSTNGIYRWNSSSYVRVNPAITSITNSEIDALFT